MKTVQIETSGIVEAIQAETVQRKHCLDTYTVRESSVAWLHSYTHPLDNYWDGQNNLQFSRSSLRDIWEQNELHYVERNVSVIK